MSDIMASPKRAAFLRKWVPTDLTYASFIGAMHAVGWCRSTLSNPR
jgi:stearoyl-CoA desaturase (delta-9 desaturase)